MFVRMQTFLVDNNIKRDKHQGMLIPFMFLWSLLKRVELYAQAGSAAYVTALCYDQCLYPAAINMLLSADGTFMVFLQRCLQVYIYLHRAMVAAVNFGVYACRRDGRQ